MPDRVADETLPLIHAERTDGAGGHSEHEAAERDDLKGVIE